MRQQSSRPRIRRGPLSRAQGGQDNSTNVLLFDDEPLDREQISSQGWVKRSPTINLLARR
jgi:hypothetical protein